jgi:protein tyrosine phosphatase (PTP) superfamily phosphohydrolase (DUF442 family)
MSLRGRLRIAKLAWAASARDLDNRAAKKRAVWYLLFFDHGILRSVWRNFAEVAPGVFRANHPSPEMLVRYMRRGIRTVVNLRGASQDPPYQLERLSAQRLGITLVDVDGLTARAAPPREALIAALDALRSAEKPVLMHCKSGADRTSLVAAIYLLAECGATLRQARRQFSPRFIHFRWTRTGVLDHILDAYEAVQSRIGFEDWLRGEYDAGAIEASFKAGRAGA